MTEWLKKEVSGWSLLATVQAFMIFQIMFILFVFTMASVLGEPLITDGFTLAVLLDESFLKILITGAIVEEMFLRAPLVVPIHYGLPAWVVYMIAGAISLFYGGFYQGTVNVVLQSVTSFVLCLQFLKCGGFQGHYPKSLGLCIATNMALKLLNAGVIMFLLS